MKNLLGICFFTFLILFSHRPAAAKTMDLKVSYTEFMSADGERYIDLYFLLIANSIDFSATEDGQIGGAEITVALIEGETISAADKFRLTSGALSDTTNLPYSFVNQVRLPISEGKFKMSLDIVDINNPDENYHLEQDIETQLKATEVDASGILFLESYQASTSENAFSKSGFDLVPRISDGVNFFDENANQLSFYSELYNTEKFLGEGQPYVVKYYLRDGNNGKVLNNFASFSKKEAQAVQPVLAGFSIEKLRTGNYELVLEALDTEGKAFVSKSSFFYRKNNIPTITPEEMDGLTISNSFVGNLGGLDSLYQFIEYLSPISADAEIMHQKELLAEADLEKMQSYFYSFWYGRNSGNPGLEWSKYYKEVKFVNRNYTSGLRSGYKTDRGRVHLSYGAPTRKDVRKMDPNVVDYEIWQYDRITTPYAPQQTNKMFVFAEFQPSSEEYDLLHSTAIGELSSPRWRYRLSLGSGGADGGIERDFRSNRDEFGSRTNNNILLESTGSDRNR